jgi:16S rRNA (guanine1516-N2)-methyltransferase
MFPPKKKISPLPPGHIQLLNQIVGSDIDADQLFFKALQTGAKRVVVKRPTYSRSLGENPVAIHKGKQVRYEVYKKTDHGLVF